MYIKVTLPYDKNWEALEWAKQNCPGYITNDVHQDEYLVQDTTRIDYYFTNKKDQLIFMLRWG